MQWSPVAKLLRKVRCMYIKISLGVFVIYASEKKIRLQANYEYS